MTWQQPIGTEGHGFHIAFPNSAGGAVQARKQLINFIQHFRLDRQIIADIEAAVGEALANAAGHGYRPISVDHPVAHAPRGYGLFLMQALVDELEFRNDGKTVWFRKHFRAGCRGDSVVSQDSDPTPESNPASNKKIDAIYSLRLAAEAKAIAELKADANSTPATRDALLDAQLDLESKTQDAIEACHECGFSHPSDERHFSMLTPVGN